jgi:HlyD family secretion protein
VSLQQFRKWLCRNGRNPGKGIDMSKRHFYNSKSLWLVLILVSVGGAFGAWEFLGAKTENTTYIFGTVDRGTILTQVEMTGTLAAVTTVAVGTQVSGTVAELYADFNSEVKKGQVLAKLDPALFQTQLDQAEASVKTDEAVLNNDLAGIGTVKANIEKAKVDLLNSTRKYKMTKGLFDEGLETKDDLDSAQAAMDSSSAALSATQSQLVAAQSALKADQARMDQARANLKNAQVNLEHTIITSPISGTVISRNVDRGQTVAASFSTPTMFTIGEDLTKMQVITNTDEADVGKLKPGMEAVFTVDAYPGELFHGRIRQVRLAATTVQNVVTYNAVVDVPNPDLRLKPGMTANVKITIDRAENVLRVPNAALRFRPDLSDTQMADAFKRAGEEQFYAFYRNRSQSGTAANAPRVRSGSMAMGFAAGNRGGTASETLRGGESGNEAAGRERRAPVWILGSDKLLLPIVVKLGLTDGVQTEIVAGKLKAGDKVILSAEIGAGKSTVPASTRGPSFGGPMGRGFR